MRDTLRQGEAPTGGLHPLDDSFSVVLQLYVGQGETSRAQVLGKNVSHAVLRPSDLHLPGELGQRSGGGDGRRGRDGSGCMGARGQGERGHGDCSPSCNAVRHRLTVRQGSTREQGRGPEAATLFSFSRYPLRIAVHAELRHVRVVQLLERDGDGHVATVRASPLVPVARREDVVRRPPILPDQTTQVAETLAAAEMPEGPLAEEQIRGRASVAGSSRGEPDHGRACRVQRGNHPAVLLARSCASASIMRAAMPSMSVTGASRVGQRSCTCSGREASSRVSPTSRRTGDTAPRRRAPADHWPSRSSGRSDALAVANAVPALAVVPPPGRVVEGGRSNGTSRT
jgi:hypothetical protein